MQASRYNRRGVSAGKEEVHQAIAGLDKGLYPLAFCKVMPDIVGRDTDYVNIMHADTAGTKTSLAYLYWRETGDLNVWKGIAQDAIVMNVDDMGCVGCVDQIMLSSTIGRNKHLISGDVLTAIIQAAAAFAEEMAQHGVHIHLTGGETADVGDVVRSIDVGYTTFARLPKEELIVNNIQAGDVIIGWASYGQATYESSYNSGIGSNGLTSARHDVLSKHYMQTYPESFDAHMPEDVTYSGSRRLTDTVQINGQSYIVGQLLLSPTRTYLPVIKKLVDSLPIADIHGLIHCTGGAQTKVKKFAPGKRIIKDQLFETPPVFDLIQKESATDWREMYQVFNMGHRMEVYVAPEHADTVIASAKAFGIDAKQIGRVENASQAEVVVQTAQGTFEY